MRALGAAISLLLLTACSAPQTRALLDEPPGLSPHAEIDATPFFPQSEYHCGPAALATVLKFRGLDVVPDDLVDDVYLPQRKGSLQTEIVAATRSRGLLAYPLNDQLESLLRELDAGNPVLVMQNLGLDWVPLWHYAVAIGYDLDERTIILRSGTRERHVLPLATFERTWSRTERWALVVISPHQLPATVEHDAFLRTALDLERIDRLASAHAAYTAAAERWPQSAPAHFAMGNAAYRRDIPDEAVTAFTRTVVLQPRNAAAWNNLAWSLRKSGCAESANTALRCAIALNPDDAEIKRSVVELPLSAMASSAPTRCSVPRCPVE